MLSVSLVLWVWPGSLPGECTQCIPCTVGVTREPTGWVCSVYPLSCGCDQGAYRVSMLSVSLVLWVWPGSLLDECAQCIPCTVGVAREPTGWVCSVYPLFCGCDQGAYRVSMLSVSLVLWVWPGSYWVSVLSVSLVLWVRPGSLPGEYAQCVPCTVGATRVPTGWVCSVCPLHCWCDQGATGWVCSVYPLSCGCYQGAYQVSMLSVSLVLWVLPGSLPGECAQCIPCPVGTTREPTGWVYSAGFPLDLKNLEKWEYTWKTWKYHGILKN